MNLRYCGPSASQSAEKIGRDDLGRMRLQQQGWSHRGEWAAVEALSIVAGLPLPPWHLELRRLAALACLWPLASDVESASG